MGALSERRWLAAAAAIAAVIAVPLFIGRGKPNSLARLIAAAPRDHRLIEARVSQFPWARLQSPTRGAAEPDPQHLKLAGAAGEVLARTAGRADPAAQHAAAVAYLMIGRPAESVTALERAARTSSDPRLWNDLAAARYAIAVGNDRPSQLPEALGAADRALRADARFAEACFNRALILERMGLRELARAAWQKYLDIDPGSEWSTEARARLRSAASVPDFKKELERAPAEALVRDFPQQARTHAEGPLLAEWGGGAEGQLALVRAIGEALAAQNGERLVADAVAAIDGASGSRRADLAAAHQLFHLGRIDNARRELASAEAKLRQAAELFRRGGSAMSEAAEFWATSAALGQGRSGAREELARLRARVDRDRHRALAAQIQWELAVYANVEGDWGAAVREADASAAIFRQLGEHLFAADAEDVGTYALELMGQTDLAWRRRIAALTALAGDAHRARRAPILHAAGVTLAARGQAAAAAAVMDLTIAEGETQNPIVLADMLADRARLAFRAGDLHDARETLAEARETAAKIADAGRRAAVEAHIDLAEAMVRSDGAMLDRVIAFFEKHRQTHLLPEALLQRARAFRSAGDVEKAAAGYTAALQVVERQRSSFRGAAPAFLDTAAEIISDAIELQLSRGDAAAALAVAERARGNARPTDVPAGVAVIEYAVLPRSIAIFCATKGGVVAETMAIDRRELAGRATSFAESVRRRAPADEIARDGAALHRLLIAPLRLSGIDELVIVPDRELYAVPFGALFDEKRGRHLIEDFTLRFAPSARGAPIPEAGALAPALVIADPPTPRWPRLPNARAEAESIAASLGATLLAGESATRRRFIAEAGRSSLIHYAGHADSDVLESYGALLLAADRADSGILGSGEIARLPLARRPLVVLAACGTFRGDPLHVSGMSSLARSFLEAGARAVVGTLWEIDDGDAAPLFVHFHRELRAGAAPARALRSAQLAMLHSSDPRFRHPASWSSHALLSD